ncbi:MAG TPA: sigma-70 family RNA polymerase sigma factor [Thermoanaerobaculia bacterium]|nr:sigma-70 family RNA polymerase sigma factor [Thermoanaerobaculia bacterium]
MTEILQANDRALHPLLEAADENAAERAMETLIARAEGVAGQVVAYYRRRSLIGPDDADEILSAVRNRLFLKLRRVRGAASQGIASFDGYVAGVAYNAVNDLFRQRHPDRRTVEATAEANDLPDTAPTPLVRLEQRADVRQLWREIQLLRPHQRAALLLNLRGDDGRNMVGLFVLIGIASIEDVAEALAMPIEELASLWNDLPLDDLGIAARLGLTRQQVINLRRSARDRLERRMRLRVVDNNAGIRTS